MPLNTLSTLAFRACGRGQQGNTETQEVYYIHVLYIYFSCTAFSIKVNSPTNNIVFRVVLERVILYSWLVRYGGAWTSTRSPLVLLNMVSSCSLFVTKEQQSYCAFGANRGAFRSNRCRHGCLNWGWVVRHNVIQSEVENVNFSVY